MDLFTGWQYLLIDAANQAPLHLDKEVFQDRIDWAEANLDCLESIANSTDWKQKPLYIKAVQAIRKAQQGEATGHMVGFDAVCSGLQIMSALTGCEAGANATGLIDPNRRADAYTECTDIMARRQPGHTPPDRNGIKQGVMTALYGSKAEPKKVFGDGTDELQAFWESLYELGPGACELLDNLLESWQPYALQHEWTLPDGGVARVKVMQPQDHRIEVDELNHSTFTYLFYENKGEKKGVKNAANVIHSIDAYVLRSLIRRCNYDRELLEWAEQHLARQATFQFLGEPDSDCHDDQVNYYLERWEASKMADMSIINHLCDETIYCLPANLTNRLLHIVRDMLKHQPFEVITVHDEFKCHANHMNHLRLHYREILAELADSEVLSDIFSQLHGQKATYGKKSLDLGEKIRLSNYAIC